MSNKKNMSLDEVMGNKPNVNHIDLTKGGAITNDKADAGVTASDTQPVARRARPVTTGPIDFSTMKDADVDKILPRRQPKPSQEEENMMSALDMAVAREKEKISERMDAIIEAQDQEIEEAEARAEEEELDNELYGESSYATSSRFIPETDDENEEEDYFPAEAINNRVSVDMESEKEELVETIMTDPVQYETRPEPVHSLDVENHRGHVTDEVIDAAEKEYYEKTVIPADEATTPVIKEEEVQKKPNEEFDLIKELGLEDDEEEEPEVNTNSDDEEEAKGLIEDVKAQIKERINPIRKSIDISKFTISKKAVSAQKVMKMAVKAHQTVADWMLYTAEKPISVSGLSGAEILKLNPENTSRNRLNTFKDIYHIIYDHIIDGNKPDFETWMKKTNFVDLQHIYFALYMATFGNSNFVNLECPKCKKIFIKDVKIEDMIEYTDDKAKAKVREIMRQDSTTHKKDEYNVDIVQISNTYAFAIKTPSIWNVIIETASLSDRILEKYSDLVDIISYIDTVYIINEATSELVPIDYKIDPNDQAKSAARRVKAFHDVISSLSSEDYFYLRNVISEYDKNTADVNYIIPAATCPDCATEIPANKEITADALVFTRHQLAAIGNI